MPVCDPYKMARNNGIHVRYGDLHCIARYCLVRFGTILNVDRSALFSNSNVHTFNPITVQLCDIHISRFPSYYGIISLLLLCEVKSANFRTYVSTKNTI